MAPRDGLGAGGVGEQCFALVQLDEVGAQERRACAGQGVAAARSGGRPVDRLHDRKDLAFGDDVADLGAQRDDLAITRRTHLVLHLHRLDDGDERTRGNAIAGIDGNRNDAARERRADVEPGSRAGLAHRGVAAPP